MSGTDDQGRDDLTLFLDDEEVPFSRGETIYEVAERHQREIPTLCYDPRLDPFGGCRMCIVEAQGRRELESDRSGTPARLRLLFRVLARQEPVLLPGGYDFSG